MVLVVLAVLTTLAITRANDSRPPVEPSILDVPFEYFDGTAGNLADFAGVPVVINFWASWCPACVAELPDFEQVHGRFGDRLIFLGINMQEIDPESADVLIQESGVTYLLGHDRDGSIFAGFGGFAMPTTVLIDEFGNVALTHSGAIFADDLEALISEELLSS
ncbi:MAG: TlpA family protein disulfide reductase [Acidimicrobiia bacterium]